MYFMNSSQICVIETLYWYLELDRYGFVLTHIMGFYIGDIMK